MAEVECPAQEAFKGAPIPAADLTSQGMPVPATTTTITTSPADSSLIPSLQFEWTSTPSSLSSPSSPAGVDAAASAGATLDVVSAHGGVSTTDDDDDDLSDLDTLPPAGKRLAPVGANDDDDMKLTDGQYRNGGHHHHHNYDYDYDADSDDAALAKELASPSPSHASAASAANYDARVLRKRILEMEEEQEELNTSLMSMTSHFAKVQLRLQQVVSAPAERKEGLLKELEHFAFRGIPNLSSPRPGGVNGLGGGGGGGGLEDDLEYEEDAGSHGGGGGGGSGGEEEKADQGYKDRVSQDDLLAAQRKKHTELIHQLKGQLEELESYAYESGEGIVPSNMLLERQRIVMEQLKSRLNLNMDNIIKLSEDELKAEVDSAVGQIVNPLKMKSHLVNQLKTQITDLEMFIQFLQSETSTMLPLECDECGCNKHSGDGKAVANVKGPSAKAAAATSGRAGVSKFRTRTHSEQEEIRKQTVSILQKAMAVLQLAAISQFSCASGGGAGANGGHFSKNTLKKTAKANHYGDLRARLELSLDHMLDACSKIECFKDELAVSRGLSSASASSASTSDLDSQPEYLMSSPEVTAIVRKELAPAIRDLMQHGLVQTSSSTSLVPFMGCMSGKNPSSTRGRGGNLGFAHAWDVVLRFYQLKQGPEFNCAPQRKLSQSFGLDLAGSAANNKQALLTTVGQIVASHAPYKRSPDAHFKAFICAGLNKRKLIPWLRLILRNQTILEAFYQPWSYVVATGFDDALRAIERLSIYVFDLPVNVAVRQFQDMSEAF